MKIDSKRKIITLCGSTCFMKEFREVERRLTMGGVIVLPPAIFGKSEGISYSPELEKHLYELHLDKIRISDCIFVIYVDNYLGESTKKEIAFAKFLGKEIIYYSNQRRDNES